MLGLLLIDVGQTLRAIDELENCSSRPVKRTAVIYFCAGTRLLPCRPQGGR